MSITKNRQNPYLYDGNLLLAETDNANKIQKVYINDGQGIIGMVRYIYKDDGTFSHYQPLYYMFDSLGSVSLVNGEDGKPLQNYKYTPYGESTNVESDPVNGLRFVGRYGGYQDDDSNLTYFWHRWYDSKDGRWISRDPIGVRGGINLFGYVKNRPIFWYDSNGLCSIPNPQPLPIPTPTIVPPDGPTTTPPGPSPTERIEVKQKQCYDECMLERTIYCSGAGVALGAACGSGTGFLPGVLVGGGFDAICIATGISKCKEKCNVPQY